jgi:hypothetical protein
MLDQIAIKHGTDKSSAGHNYCRHYELLLGYLTGVWAKLLEIGVARGASLRMWAEWLPHARIFGLDDNSAGDCWLGDPPRVQVTIGSQSDPAVLLYLSQAGPFEVIVDDASHCPADQLAAFYALWPSVATGGWYVIEDLPTLYFLAYRDQPNIVEELTVRLPNIIASNDEIGEIHVFGGPGDSLNCDGILFLRKRWSR